MKKLSFGEIVIRILQISLFCVAVIACCCFDREQVLFLEDQSGRKAAEILLGSSGFTLEYRHSVHLTPVYEVYEIGSGDKLLLKETRFYSLGVGMPFGAEEGTFSEEEGIFVLSGLNREFKSLPLRISAIPEHRVVIGGQAYLLLSFCEPDGVINIRTAKKWIFKK